jgi:hypothetical protein
MTWEQRINKYGDQGRFYIQNNYIYFYTGLHLMPLINSSSQPVHINDIIQKDDIYYFGSGGGAD